MKLQKRIQVEDHVMRFELANYDWLEGGCGSAALLAHAEGKK